MGGRPPSKTEVEAWNRAGRKSPTGRLGVGQPNLQNIKPPSTEEGMRILHAFQEGRSPKRGDLTRALPQIVPSQRVDGFLSQKASEVWPGALVVVVLQNALGANKEWWELHRPGRIIVCVGHSFQQARQGVAAIVRNWRAKQRESGKGEKGPL